MREDQLNELMRRVHRQVSGHAGTTMATCSACGERPAAGGETCLDCLQDDMGEMLTPALGVGAEAAARKYISICQRKAVLEGYMRDLCNG